MSIVGPAVLAAWLAAGPCFPRYPMTDFELNAYRRNASGFPPVSAWATNKVTNFSYLFVDSDENVDVRSWDVSNGLHFDGMFLRASKFNQSLSAWDFGNAETFSRFLEGAASFDQPLNLVAPNAVDFSYLLAGATAFNKSLRIVGAETNVTFEGLLENASAFNSPLVLTPLSRATSIENALRNAATFDRRLPWDTLNPDAVTTGVLEGATAFKWSLGCWPVPMDIKKGCPNSTACVRCAPDPDETDKKNVALVTSLFLLIGASLFSIFAQ